MPIGEHDIKNRNVLRLKWKSEGEMDDESGDDETGTVR